MWEEYRFSYEVAKRIRKANTVAVMYNNGDTRIRSGEGKDHLAMYDCSSLIHKFRIMEDL